GPGDPSGRFAYWPARLADAAPGAAVLAPGAPDEPVQLIDVRDLAAWIVDSAEQQRTGTFDAVGHVTTRQALLEEVAVGVGTAPGLVWVPAGFLAEHDVRPWSGPRSLPLWVPLPEYAGLMAHDAAPSFAAGLTTRPLADTARDTLDWLRATPYATVTGLTRDEEAEALRAWRASDPA
ncbi:MAG: epimerase, partial [Nocardioides sp.]|nr:epimerase [Nocardioides sp.]